MKGNICFPQISQIVADFNPDYQRKSALSAGKYPESIL
jgi:hypothetical protein